jgi:hypothetical protein
MHFPGAIRIVDLYHARQHLDKFSFRLNGKNVKNHTMSRIDSLQANSVGVRIMYKDLVAA